MSRLSYFVNITVLKTWYTPVHSSRSSRTKLRIGIIVFSYDRVDHKEALQVLNDVLDEVLRKSPAKHVELVSGLTDIGIPAVVYRIAKERGWETGGVACKKAVAVKPNGKSMRCFPTDWREIEGEQWGDESKYFLDNFDVLVRVGGAGQCDKEEDAWRQKGGDRPVFFRPFSLLPK